MRLHQCQNGSVEPIFIPDRHAHLEVSIAEIAEMPMLHVMCRELGRTADAIEKQLEPIFHLGRTWNSGKDVEKLSRTLH